jgi:uncharacterized protein (DUF1800 family)
MLAPVADSTRWTLADAAHTLRRLQFGYSPDQLKQAVAAGRQATLDRLLSPQPESAEFQEVDGVLRTTAVATGNLSDLQVWWLYRMVHSANPLTEKLTLLWHNHFATSQEKVRSVSLMLRQNDLQRAESSGSFAKLLHSMARDPAMLVWLDGEANRRRHPNENFAREVMELFSLGVGNYSEKDIQEAARAFSGWQLRDGEFWFNDNQHDPRPKTIFGETGKFDGNSVVDLCLKQPACARYLAFKLLRAFVMPEPGDAEISAVAERLRLHGLVIGPVMNELVRSQLFYDARHRRSLIKSPLDFVLGMTHSLLEAVRWQPVAQTLAELGQSLFAPPSVKGWDGQRLWITSSTLILRANSATDVATSGRFGVLTDAVRGQLAQPGSAVEFLQSVVLGGEADAETLAQIRTMAQTGDSQAGQAALQLALQSPEYQLM